MLASQDGTNTENKSKKTEPFYLTPGQNLARFCKKKNKAYHLRAEFNKRGDNLQPLGSNSKKEFGRHHCIRKDQKVKKKNADRKEMRDRKEMGCYKDGSNKDTYEMEETNSIRFELDELLLEVERAVCDSEPKYIARFVADHLENKLIGRTMMESAYDGIHEYPNEYPLDDHCYDDDEDRRTACPSDKLFIFGLSCAKCSKCSNQLSSIKLTGPQQVSN